MPYYFLATLFVFGAAFGSFLNVVSMRYNPERFLFDTKIIGGRSHCPYCQKTLTWYELIPIISFIIQRGKCRHCHKTLSIQYPILETIGGLIFALTPLYLSAMYAAPYLYFFSFAWIVILLILLLIAVVDIREYLIPDELNIALGIMAFVVLAVEGSIKSFYQGSFLGYYSFIFGNISNIYLNHIFAAILGAIVLGLVAYMSHGKAMGWGDVKFALAFGLLLGWADTILALALSFIIGGAFGATLIFMRRKGMKDIVPFAPFLVSGIVVTVFFGHQLMNLYFKVFLGI